MRSSHAVACKDDRMACPADDVGRAGDGVVGWTDMHGVGEWQRSDSGRHWHSRDVLGEDKAGRARTFALRYGEGFAYDFRHGAGDGDHAGPLGDRAEHGDQVHDLVRFLVQAGHVALGADGYHGCGACVGLRDRQGEVQRTGAERCEAHARFAGQMALRGRHESGALLVPRQDEADASVALQSLHKGDVLLAGNAIDDVHAFVDEAFDEQVGDVALMCGGFLCGAFVRGCLMRGGSRFDRLLGGGFVCCFGAVHGVTC